ncbi:MAG: VRR-NUC domain-containing protein [Clostridiales bacterium]|nr:VRR-NUC domain-containing protein [Clostridiales bacterium]
MRESTVESFLNKKVKEKKGLSLKFVSPGLDGVPDRIILLRNGKIAFAEIKASGKKLRIMQLKRKAQIESLGFKVFVIDNIEMIEGVLNEIQST